MATSRPHTREIEGRDSVGLYLDEIARTPLLDAITAATTLNIFHRHTERVKLTAIAQRKSIAATLA